VASRLITSFDHAAVFPSPTAKCYSKRAEGVGETSPKSENAAFPALTQSYRGPRRPPALAVPARGGGGRPPGAAAAAPAASTAKLHPGSPQPRGRGEGPSRHPPPRAPHLCGTPGRAPGGGTPRPGVSPPAASRLGGHAPGCRVNK